MISLENIFFYPVKSCQGCELDQVDFNRKGLAHDRSWMIVNEQGEGLSQKDHAVLAQIEVKLNTEYLFLHVPHSPPLQVKLDDPSLLLKDLSVLGRSTNGLVYNNDSISHWLSDYLGFPCHLARIDPNHKRMTTRKPEQAFNEVGFADAYPITIISQASLDQLNQKLPEAVPMNRFRPNFVVEGCEPHEEDTWQTIKIGKILFHAVKKVDRCVMISIDQVISKKSKEPMKTLTSYRKENGLVMFGHFFNHENLGRLQTGMEVTILKRK